ncbi:MAG: hypothetical protein ACERKZ_15085 [Lachnotalea sp.]
MEQQNEESKIINRINKVVDFFKQIKNIRNHINKRMEGKYSSTLIALVATAIATVLMISMLFLPHYLGVADDGSISKVMNSAGVYYMQSEIADVYNNYFVKTYSNVISGYQTKDTLINSQIMIVKAAVYLDNLVTRDRYFDIRFLGLIYSIFYVPAIYLLIKQACMRVKVFSEGFVIGFAGILVFADVGYITYFNSFYPEALWFISLMYCIAAALSFQEKRSANRDFLSLLMIIIAGIVLTTSRSQTAFIAILLAVFCLKLLFVRQNWMWGLICVMSAFLLSFVAIICMINMNSDYDTTSKFHAMTRGVLLESSDPGETLSEFGIDSSYEMLADASSFDYLPIVQATDEVLTDGFLNQYTQIDIALYYAKHPGSFLSMIDVAMKYCFNTRREYCGNYEKSVGFPERAKSFFWGAWGNFKSNSLPKTIGYFFFLVGVVVIQFKKGYSIRHFEERRSTIFLDTMIVIALICLCQAAITIVNSGDAEMVRHSFLISFGIDLITYYAFSEVIHRINIF